MLLSQNDTSVPTEQDVIVNTVGLKVTFTHRGVRLPVPRPLPALCTSFPVSLRSITKSTLFFRE